jgi:hypothetical protein
VNRSPWRPATKENRALSGPEALARHWEARPIRIPALRLPLWAKSQLEKKFG